MKDAVADGMLSLSSLLDPDVLANPYPLYCRLRTEDPVHWDPYLHAWIVTRYSDVVTVLTSFSADRAPSPTYFENLGAAELSPIATVMVRQMLFLDPPAHTRLRALSAQAFMPARVRVLRDHIQQVAEDLIDRIVERPGYMMELLTDFAEPFPAIITAELFGIPTKDHVQLKAWSAKFAGMLGNFQHNPEQIDTVLDAAQNLTAYFENAISEQRKHPRPGLVDSLMNSEINGDRLTDEEVIANCIVTMVGGQETTTNLICNGVLTLLLAPDRLNAASQRSGDGACGSRGITSL